MEEVTTPVDPKRAPKWRRYAIYFFAAVGLLLSVLIGVAALGGKSAPPVLSFDQGEIIEKVMARNYGKYSESERGWLYVDEATKLTYLVTVVQQKKVDGNDGEELYFVTSGRSLNSPNETDSFYGVFQVSWNNGQLLEFGDARRPSGVNPVTPDRVLFEALSADVWGWVVKVKDLEISDGSVLDSTSNVVLAPYDNGIAVLAEFYGAFNIVGAGSCEETERLHASWKQAQGQPKSAPAEGEANAMSPEEQADDNIEPPRCTRLQWTYRTDPPADLSFTPLYITRKAGMRNGDPVAAKTWKVLFDPKSHTYLLPKELKDVAA